MNGHLKAYTCGPERRDFLHSLALTAIGSSMLAYLLVTINVSDSSNYLGSLSFQFIILKRCRALLRRRIGLGVSEIECSWGH